MYKIMTAALALTVSATAAQAISRHNSTSLSCQRIQSIIQEEGAAIMRYQSTRNPSLRLYDRYVSNGAFCDTEKYPVRATIPAADTNQCIVFRCVDRSSNSSQ